MATSEVMQWGAMLLGGGGFVTSGASLIAGRGGERAKAAAQMSQTGIGERDQWMKNAREDAELLRRDCNRCTRKLDRVLNAIYGMFEDLEEKILPMLPDIDHAEARQAVRATIRKVRDAISAADPEEPRRESG